MAELLPGLTVSDETMAQLQGFAADLAHWSAAINLVAPSSLSDSWNRHILDSAQLYSLAPAGARHWADLGSGGGLPGLVIAILACDQDMQITLVESDHRKSAFLRRQITDRSLNAQVRATRAEQLAPLAADVISARALAPLERLLPFVHRHLAPGGTALLPKGRRWATELEAARAGWSFDCEELPSAVDPESRILRLTRLRPKD